MFPLTAGKFQNEVHEMFEVEPIQTLEKMGGPFEVELEWFGVEIE